MKLWKLKSTVSNLVLCQILFSIFCRRTTIIPTRSKVLIFQNPASMLPRSPVRGFPPSDPAQRTFLLTQKSQFLKIHNSKTSSENVMDIFQSKDFEKSSFTWKISHLYFCKEHYYQFWHFQYNTDIFPKVLIASKK